MRQVPEVIDTLEVARDAAASQGWRKAYDAYAGLDTRELEPSDLESYGEAAWWSGKLDEAITLRERAYAAFTAEGNALASARMALTLSWDYEGRGAFSVASGWPRARSACSRACPRHPSTAGCCWSMRSPPCSPKGISRRHMRRSTPPSSSRSASAIEMSRCSRCQDGARLHQGRRDREGPRAPRRGNRVGHVRRPARALGGPRLLHDDQLLPRPRRLPPGSRVDGGGEQVVRPPRRDGFPGRLSHTPGRGDEASRRLAGRGGAGRRGLRRALRLRSQHHRERVLRDRRDPAPAGRLRGRGGGVPDVGRARTRSAARPGAPPPRRREDRGGGRRHHADARRGRGPTRTSPTATGTGRDRDRGR